jgi:trehalose synthase-fused probable maltokinase
MSQPTVAFEPMRLNRALGPWIFASDEGRHLLESEILPKWLPSRRWFGGKARVMERVSIEAAMPWPQTAAHVLAVTVRYLGNAPDRYIVPLAFGPSSDFDDETGVIARGENSNVLSDALFNPHFRASLLDLIASNSTTGVDGAAITGKGSKFLTLLPVKTLTISKILGVEQSNTSVIYGGQLFLKLFRRLDAGINPDAEITRFLSEQQGFPYVPRYAGELEARLGAESYPMGLMLGCVENRGDAWTWALAHVASYYEGHDPSDSFRRIGELGQHTAKMHTALAADSHDPAFRPEPLTRTDFDQLAASVTARLDALVPILRTKQSAGDFLAGEVLSQEAAVRESIAALRALPAGAAKTRHHGDYHLGQVLDTGTDWTIIDFEGEPTRSLAERRQKRSPLRDVAGMLRSFHYAAHSGCPSAAPEDRNRAEAWTDAASAAFLGRYMETAGRAVFLPSAEKDRVSLLTAYVLEKALYEIDYELNNRPDWLPIPLRGLLRALAA